MSHIIIDRRKNDKNKSIVNRNRYVRRVKEQVKHAVKQLIRDGKILDSVSPQGGSKKITIKKSLKQPHFDHAYTGGTKEKVFPGNKEYVQGDKIPKPKREKENGDRSREGSPEGSSQDEFTFSITRDEFLNIFFEDLELPDLVKKELTTINEYVQKRSGFTPDGNPSRLNILRSMKQAKGRRFALRSKNEKRLKEIEKRLFEINGMLACGDITSKDERYLLRKEAQALELEMIALRRKIKIVPFIDEVDLRYNRWDKFPVPATQAVMFGIMDVSSSMGEWEKEMGKRFFILMLLFLQKKYQRVDIVWIRHTTEPKEVTEEEFFNSQESGGTKVSPALKLMSQIQKDRYPLNQWNVFGVQISDGDNWTPDNPSVKEIMEDTILPMVQYFAYIEVKKGSMGIYGLIVNESDLYPILKELSKTYTNFVTAIITDIKEIFPVFRKLFEKKTK
jgi:uncharacterized protein